MLLHKLLKYYKVIMELSRFGFQQQATIVLDDTCITQDIYALLVGSKVSGHCGCQTLYYLWNSHPVKQPGFTAWWLCSIWCQSYFSSKIAELLLAVEYTYWGVFLRDTYVYRYCMHMGSSISRYFPRNIEKCKNRLVQPYYACVCVLCSKNVWFSIAWIVVF